MKSQIKNTLEVVHMLQQVISGNRGFVSLTEESAKRGMDRNRLISLAEKMGLKVKPHGRYGFCANR